MVQSKTLPCSAASAEVKTMKFKHGPRMAKVRQSDTMPEMQVRTLLRNLGVRYSLHRRTLPGTPDICVASCKRAIFVHGCFWHRHDGCKRATTPQVRRVYWLTKFQKNVARDKNAVTALRKLGWKVTVVWECECRNLPKLTRRLAVLTASPRQTRSYPRS